MYSMRIKTYKLGYIHRWGFPLYEPTQLFKMSEWVSTRSKTAQEASKSKPLCSTPSDRPLSQSAKKKRAAGVTKETDLKAKEEEYRLVAI